MYQLHRIFMDKLRCGKKLETIIFWNKILSHKSGRTKLAHAKLAHAKLAHAKLAHAKLAHAKLAHAKLAHAKAKVKLQRNRK